MNKAEALLPVFFLVTASLSAVASLTASGESPRIVVPDNYVTIGEAVSNAKDGDVIFVKSGIYVENQIVINKPVSLLGENPENTTIKLTCTASIYEAFGYDFYNFSPYGIVITANNVTIDGFKVIPDGTLNLDEKCINVTGSFTQIKHNIIEDIHGIRFGGSNQALAENNMTGTPIEIYSSFNDISANNVVGGGVALSGYHNIILDNAFYNSSIDVSGSLNTIHGNNITGSLALWKSDKATIAKNNITSGGISLTESPNCTVKTNVVHMTGICLKESSGIIIENNFIKKGNISLKGSCSNIIENNNITGGSILLEYDDDSVQASSDNVIRKNRITNGTGLNLLFRSDDNLVYANLVENCLFGLTWSVPGVQNGTIYHNNFVNNTVQFSLINSEWAPSWGFYIYNSGYFYVDNGSAGNYWSNYDGIDANGDGFGDTPYIIQEGNEEKSVPFIIDRYPLMFPFDVENNVVFLPESFPWLPVAALSVAAVAVVAVTSLVYLRKRKRQTDLGIEPARFWQRIDRKSDFVS